MLQSILLKVQLNALVKAPKYSRVQPETINDKKLKYQEYKDQAFLAIWLIITRKRAKRICTCHNPKKQLISQTLPQEVTEF